MNQLIESLTYDKSTSNIFSISALGHAERNVGSANHTYDAVIAHQALRSTDQTGKTRFNIWDKHPNIPGEKQEIGRFATNVLFLVLILVLMWYWEYLAVSGKYWQDSVCLSIATCGQKQNMLFTSVDMTLMCHQNCKRVHVCNRWIPVWHLTYCTQKKTALHSKWGFPKKFTDMNNTVTLPRQCITFLAQIGRASCRERV